MRSRAILTVCSLIFIAAGLQAPTVANAATITNSSVPCSGLGSTSVAAAPGESFTLFFTDLGVGPGRCNDAGLAWDATYFSFVSIPSETDIDPAAGNASPFAVTFTLSPNVPVGTVTLIRLWDGIFFGNPIPVTVVPPAEPPPPWWQSVGRAAGTDCDAGWASSWAEWAKPITGGWVCNRAVFWFGSRWLQSTDPDNLQDAIDWDGE